MRHWLRRVRFWLLLLLLLPALAWVSAGVAMAASCSVASAGVVFGAYDPFQGSASDSAGDISVSCSAATAYTIALGTGVGSYAGRQMVGGHGALVYNLYLDASRSMVWGDGSAGSGPASGSAADGGVASHHTIYGRIPARQNLPVGSYVDSVSILISY